MLSAVSYSPKDRPACRIQALPILSIRLASPDQFVQVDSEMLIETWKLLPKLPMEHLDILIVDEMGKTSAAREWIRMSSASGAGTAERKSQITREKEMGHIFLSLSAQYPRFLGS